MQSKKCKEWYKSKLQLSSEYKSQFISKSNDYASTVRLARHLREYWVQKRGCSMLTTCIKKTFHTHSSTLPITIIKKSYVNRVGLKPRSSSRFQGVLGPGFSGSPDTRVPRSYSALNHLSRAGLKSSRKAELE